MIDPKTRNYIRKPASSWTGQYELLIHAQPVASSDNPLDLIPEVEVAVELGEITRKKGNAIVKEAHLWHDQLRAEEERAYRKYQEELRLSRQPKPIFAMTDSERALYEVGEAWKELSWEGKIIGSVLMGGVGLVSVMMLVALLA